jgi:hypothetical protein
MAFNRLFNAMGKLVETEVEIPDKMPCKSEILALRECVKSKGGVSSSYAWPTIRF